MNNQKSQQTKRATATAKIEFQIHFINFIVVNTILAFINLSLNPEYLWFKWPLIGWGIGIVFHALNIFLSGNTKIKDRLIEKETKNIK